MTADLIFGNRRRLAPRRRVSISRSQFRPTSLASAEPVRLHYLAQQELFFMELFSRLGRLLSLGFAFILCAAGPPHSLAQEVERTPSGVIVHASTGTVRIDVCSDSVLHVVASTRTVPKLSVVPSVVKPCSDSTFTSSLDNERAYVSTGRLKVDAG